jgi:hypothetical protein
MSTTSKPLLTATNAPETPDLPLNLLVETAIMEENLQGASTCTAGIPSLSDVSSLTPTRGTKQDDAGSTTKGPLTLKSASTQEQHLEDCYDSSAEEFVGMHSQDPDDDSIGTTEEFALLDESCGEVIEDKLLYAIKEKEQESETIWKHETILQHGVPVGVTIEAVPEDFVNRIPKTEHGEPFFQTSTIQENGVRIASVQSLKRRNICSTVSFLVQGLLQLLINQQVSAITMAGCSIIIVGSLEMGLLDVSGMVLRWRNSFLNAGKALWINGS